jgi:hypothetical protein
MIEGLSDNGLYRSPERDHLDAWQPFPHLVWRSFLEIEAFEAQTLILPFWSNPAA